MNSSDIDTIGGLRLIEDLVTADIRVAKPIKDDGIDFLAYVDRGQFAAIPLQLKTGSARFFNLDRKYEHRPELVLVYQWDVLKPERATYALSYKEAYAIIERLGYTNQKRWKEEGYTATSNPGKTLVELLSPHLMSPQKWQERLRQASRTA